MFFALFRVLNGLAKIASGEDRPIGPMTREVAAQAESSTLFGAQLSSTFLGSDDLSVKVLTVVLIILMSDRPHHAAAAEMKNMPAAALDNPFAQQQKILLYALPVIFAVSGVNFPIGVLIYWLTTNLWSMAQQFSSSDGCRRGVAGRERAERRISGVGSPEPGPGADAGSTNGVRAEGEAPKPQRQQPKKQSRSQRGGGKRPPGGAQGKPRPGGQS